MTVIYLVLPLALVIAAAAVWAFLWAVRDGRLDDLHAPAASIPIDDDGVGAAAYLRRSETVSHR